MPANLPSSFASAAAGQNANRDARGGRGDGRGGGEWTRRDGRPNGTLTFRRASTTPGQSSQTTAASDSTPQTPVEPAASQFSSTASYDFASQPALYGKQSILGLFHNVPPQSDVSDVLEPSWTPGQVNGNSSRGWGKSAHAHANQDPNSCWLSDAANGPATLRNLSAEEKEAFASDVNSPLKPPNQKDTPQQAVPNGRKASISQGSGPGFGLASPTSASRPGTRRRETTDANPFATGGLASPSGPGRFPQGDGFGFNRKGNDPKEAELSEEEGAAATRGTPQGRGGFGSLIRSNTAGTPSGGGMQSPNISSLWGQSGNQPQTQSQSGSGMGNFGQFAMPGSSAVGSGGRGGSRFANLIPKDNPDNAGSKPSEDSNPDLNRSWRSRPRTDTDPFGDEGRPSGSAALGGAKDTSPPPMPNPVTNSMGPGPFETPVKGSAGDFGMSGLNLGQEDENGQGPISPSETNPYRSPLGDRGDDHDESEGKQHGGAIGSEQQQHQHQQQASAFGTFPRGFPGAHPFDGSDRSQTSSAGPKGYPSLSNLTGWPAPAPTGTPDRERQGFAGAFGNSLFSPMGGGDMQSPGLGNIGSSVFGPPSAGGIGGTGSIGRSKMGSLFPPAMQAQMQGNEQHESLSDSVPDLRQANPLGAIGRSNFVPQRDTDSPMRPGRGVFEELFPSSESRTPGGFGSIGGDAHPGLPAGLQPQSFTPGPSAGSEMPSAQVRQMVMPDRMRWVYLDPQGQVQGPFTGLEMNDWYKANFFTADLRVKKIEDIEFEPLGQLIRRIGNSREPFLVPQIGVAHGPAGATGGPFTPATPGGVVPPLSGLFPSYGRTLTAEEQNNLERRKQEEQFAMAQQREVMMRQQAISRIQPGGVQGSLHHHSSAHSLQSQPSFGSISSPIGAPHQQPPPGTGNLAAGSSFLEGGSVQQGSGQPPVGSSMEPFRGEDTANLNPMERQLLSANNRSGNDGFFPPQPIGPAGNEAKLRANLPGTEQLSEDEEGFRDRLKQFEGLRAEHDAEHDDQVDVPQQSIEDAEEALYQQHRRELQPEMTGDFDEQQQLSLTEQVQKAQAAAAAQSAATGLPSSFPPPRQSGTPLPAPTAQRVRSNLPDQYSRSQSGTPDTSSATEPPPLAPWAKDAGGRKGPSLKEIQEAEARNAAKAEEAAAAARRVALEQEAAAIREREKSAAITTGLPTSSTWGNGSPVPAGSPWNKPSAVKVAPGPATSSKQKTLADIQREEEARKEKAAKTVVTQAGLASAAGKRYADLATRPGHPPGFQQPQQPPTQPQAGGAPAAPPASGWATVGAGGKVKVPTGPAAQSPSRAVSAGIVKPPTAPKTMPMPMPKAPVGGAGVSVGGKNDAAMDEFNKWLHRELSRGVTGVDIDTFAATLHILPMDGPIIADAVYANSKTLNGQHFAEEFIRRKRRAEQGIVEKQPAPTGAEPKTGSASGGWSEVAKKSGAGAVGKDSAGAPEEGSGPIQGAGFKVVPGRKKGGKK